MSRARKVDPTQLEREYVFDSATPPVSITALADRYGMARSNIADIARRNRWYEKRKEVRQTVGEKVLEAMTDDWAAAQTTVRNRLIEVNLKLLEETEKAIAAGEIKITKVADVVALTATIRVLLGDQAVEAGRNEPKIIDMESTPIDIDQMVKMMPLLKASLAGGENGGTSAFEGDAGGDAPAGPEDPEPD
jgi:hypothetical protein